jgi:hypothetical protein
MLVSKAFLSLLFIATIAMSSFAVANESDGKVDAFGADEEPPVEGGLEDEGEARELQAPAWYGPAGKVILTVYHDGYPQDTAWRLSKGSREVARQRANSVNEPYKIIARTFNLRRGRYRFRIADSYNDGICCAYGNGSWNLYTEGYTQLIYASDGAFGSSETITFELF